jgi:CrcB protein
MPDGRIVRTYLVVALGGAIGSAARFWLGNLGSTLIYGTFPWGILMVNLLGCFVIGFFSEATGGTGMLEVSPDMRIFVIVGLCGGFTTFSSFSLGTLSLLQHGQFLAPLANVVLSVAGCLFAVTVGIWLVRFTNLSTEKMEDRRI